MDDSNEFEDAVLSAEYAAQSYGLTADEIISVYELRILALREQEDDE